MVQSEEIIILEVAKYKELYDPTSKYYKDTTRRVNIWKTIGEATQLPVDECQKKWKNLRDAYVSWRRRVQQNKKSGQEVKAIKEYRFAKEMEFLIPYTANRKTSSSLPAVASVSDSEPSIAICTENDDDSMAAIEENNSNNSDYAEDDVAESVITTPPDPSTPATSSGSYKRQSASVNSSSKRRNNGENTDSIVALVRERQKERDERRERKVGVSQPQMDEIDSFFYSMGQTVKRLPRDVQAGLKLKICQLITEAEIQSLVQPSS